LDTHGGESTEPNGTALGLYLMVVGTVEIIAIQMFERVPNIVRTRPPIEAALLYEMTCHGVLDLMFRHLNAASLQREPTWPEG
jgi:hypothetical protein